MTFFDIDQMLCSFQDKELISPDSDLDTTHYSILIDQMCNNTTWYMIKYLEYHHNDFLDWEKDVKVHEGQFNFMGNHTWLEIGDYLVDLSLTQFVEEAPRILVFEYNDEIKKYYHSVRVFPAKVWEENQ